MADSNRWTDGGWVAKGVRRTEYACSSWIRSQAGAGQVRARAAGGVRVVPCTPFDPNGCGESEAGRASVLPSFSPSFEAASALLQVVLLDDLEFVPRSWVTVRRSSHPSHRGVQKRLISASGFQHMISSLQLPVREISSTITFATTFSQIG